MRNPHNNVHSTLLWGLSYGADDEARTRYLNLGKVALYRVSYIRKCKSNYTQSMYLCQDFFRKKYNYLVVYNIIIF